MKKIVILIYSLLLIGCTSMSSSMESGVGKHIDVIVSSWGPPTNQFKSGNMTTYSWTNVWSNQYQVNQCVRSFTVNSSGIVTGYSFNNCPRFVRLF